MDDDPATVVELRLEVSRLRGALNAALLLERFWRHRFLLGTFPPPRKYGEGPRAMRRRDEPRA